ncbi:hypothetical protein KO481_26270 [Nocardia sp. NEAU-G5]|uniref:Uncharacterized protein n=1 Tax=Nocardia albiluteola TaxID=2842303 RepID=A0ABS6B761_9NOCA|nr:hypothetical protein [Nocardia albiluteola]MBU3065024.1 hypothetical protein [Nocardia albiluteola]
MASRRGATEQPNAQHDDVPLTGRFWPILVLTELATGLMGVVLMWSQFRAQALAFPGGNNYLTNAAQAGSASWWVPGFLGGAKWR